MVKSKPNWQYQEYIIRSNWTTLVTW